MDKRRREASRSQQGSVGTIQEGLGSSLAAESPLENEIRTYYRAAPFERRLEVTIPRCCVACGSAELSASTGVPSDIFWMQGGNQQMHRYEFPLCPACADICRKAPPSPDRDYLLISLGLILALLLSAVLGDRANSFWMGVAVFVAVISATFYLIYAVDAAKEKDMPRDRRLLLRRIKGSVAAEVSKERVRFLFTNKQFANAFRDANSSLADFGGDRLDSE